MDATKILSIGHVAGQLQTPITELAAIAELLGIVPTSTINNVPYFDAADVKQVADHIRSERTTEAVQ